VTDNGSAISTNINEADFKVFRKEGGFAHFQGDGLQFLSKHS